MSTIIEAAYVVYDKAVELLEPGSVNCFVFHGFFVNDVGWARDFDIRVSILSNVA